jgi:transposase-like protein
MQQRKQFIDEYLQEQSSLAELCRKFGISRKTGYKWVERFMSGCELDDRSRRPHHSPRGGCCLARGRDRRRTQAVAAMGTAQAPSRTSASQPGRRAAERQHLCSDLQAQWVGHSSSATAAHAAIVGAARSRCRTERGVVHGLQRGLLGRSQALLPI